MIFNKTITIYFQNKNKWQIAPDLHKKSEKCDTSRNYDNYFWLQKPKEREVGERGGEQEQQRERREQKSKAGPDDDDEDDDDNDEWGW